MLRVRQPHPQIFGHYPRAGDASKLKPWTVVVIGLVHVVKKDALMAHNNDEPWFPRMQNVPWRHKVDIFVVSRRAGTNEHKR
jgi:hypothetical protein